MFLIDVLIKTNLISLLLKLVIVMENCFSVGAIVFLVRHSDFLFQTS
jgi:hypothetical protein